MTYYPLNEPEVRVPLYRKGIAWYTDKNVKFRNPPTNNTFTLRQAFEGTDRHMLHVLWACVCFSHCCLCLFSGTIRPLYWQRPVYELDDTDSNNNGFINDDLIVWMREAAFPNFKKLYGVLNRAQGPFNQGLPSGNYSISIIYSILCSWRTELVVNGRKGLRQHWQPGFWFGDETYYTTDKIGRSQWEVCFCSFVFTLVHFKG